MLNTLKNVHEIRYERFISTRPRREYRKGLYHRHHIRPRALGGSDSADNMVVLTHREHFIAHLLLWKIFGGPMARAFWLMSNHSTGGRVTGRMYEALRKDLKLTSETKKKMSESHKGKGLGPKNVTEEWRKERSESVKQRWREQGHPRGMLGKKMSEETRKKMSEAHKGRALTEEAKRKLSLAHKGKKNSPEAIAKGKETRKGYTWSEETRAKMKEWNKNHKVVLSEETRKKLSEAAKERERKKKESGYRRSPESIRKAAEAHRGMKYKKKSIAFSNEKEDDLENQS